MVKVIATAMKSLGRKLNFANAQRMLLMFCAEYVLNSDWARATMVSSSASPGLEFRLAKAQSCTIATRLRI